MEKKNQYIAPELLLLTPIQDGLMYFTSVPGGNPDEGEPEAKPGFFEDDSEASYSLPGINYDVWAEETESESFFHKK
ncbi:MAG: hypothetical protein J6M37_04080 [Prevotella sp.]|nr:hypothetical protein [Prevotella sp.]